MKTLWVNGRVQIISLEEGDRAEAQEVDLHRAEYGTKWMLAQRGEWRVSVKGQWLPSGIAGIYYITHTT